MEPAYSDCISVDYFKKIGESDTDAAKFVSIIQTQVTQCAQVGLAVDAKCEKQRLFKCADEFNKALHLKTPKDPNELDREIKELEKRGEKPQLCRATKKFESCLGPELKECISVEFLKSLGLSDKDAKGYVHIFYQELQAQCKKQISLAVDAKCEKQRLFKCADEFNHELHLKTPKDPNDLDRQIKELEKKGEKKKKFAGLPKNSKAV